jgi:hypothetical protein
VTTAPAENFWRTVRGRWKDITRVATMIAAIVGAIFIPPPAYMSDSGKGTLVPFARYAVAITTALVAAAMVHWKRPAHRRTWIATAAAAFLLVTASYFVYNDRRDRFTAVGADGARVVIGSEYTAIGAAYMEHHPEASAGELLADAPCQSGGSECSARIVWTESSIASNKRLLGLLFVAGAMLLAATLLSAVQATLVGDAESADRPTTSPAPAESSPAESST